jgi:hypothetical protein
MNIGFKIQGSEFSVEGVELRICDLRFKVKGSELKVRGLGFRV